MTKYMKLHQNTKQQNPMYNIYQIHEQLPDCNLTLRPLAGEKYKMAVGFQRHKGSW